MPITVQTAKESITEPGSICTGQWASSLIIHVAIAPVIMPSMPPVTDIMTASMRNCVMMSRPVAPILIRRPISRVRSVTLTIMMFMMPMPPTRSDMPATQASSTVIIEDVEEIICASSCMERIVKLSS